MPTVCTQRHDSMTSAPSTPSRPSSPRRLSAPSVATSAEARTARVTHQPAHGHRMPELPGQRTVTMVRSQLTATSGRTAAGYSASTRLAPSRVLPHQGVRVPGSILGNRVVRKEDPKFLTTGGVYLDDLDLPELEGAAHVAYVRSPVAHGTISSIETSDAAAVPGVRRRLHGRRPRPGTAAVAVQPWRGPTPAGNGPRPLRRRADRRRRRRVPGRRRRRRRRPCSSTSSRSTPVSTPPPR